MADLWNFLCAVWEHGTGYLYGAVATTLLLIFPFIGPYVGFKRINPDTAIPPWALITAIAVCLFCGFFKAWNDQKDKAELANARAVEANARAEQAIAKFEEQTKPAFDIVIERVSFGAAENGVTVVLDVRVSNTGGPSTLSEYGVVVEAPDLPPVQMRPILIPDDGYQLPFADGSQAKLIKERALFLVTGKEGIKRGDTKFGSLVAESLDYSIGQFKRQGTIVKLSCRDIFNKEYQAVFVVDGPPQKFQQHHMGGYEYQPSPQMRDR